MVRLLCIGVIACVLHTILRLQGYHCKKYKEKDVSEETLVQVSMWMLLLCGTEAMGMGWTLEEDCWTFMHWCDCRASILGLQGYHSKVEHEREKKTELLPAVRRHADCMWWICIGSCNNGSKVHEFLVDLQIIALTLVCNGGFMGSGG